MDFETLIVCEQDRAGGRDDQLKLYKIHNQQILHNTEFGINFIKDLSCLVSSSIGVFSVNILMKKCLQLSQNAW